jgi:hypothetical protein
MPRAQFINTAIDKRTTGSSLRFPPDGSVTAGGEMEHVGMINENICWHMWKECKKCD